MGSIAYVTGAISGANDSTLTYAAQSIGAAASGRYVIVAASARLSPNFDGSEDLLCAIGGNAATRVAQAKTSNGNSGTVAALFVLNVPSGTTADIALSSTGGETIIRSGISVYRADGLSSATPYDSDAITRGAGTGTMSRTVTRNGDGFVIGVAHSCGNASQLHTSAHATFAGLTLSDLTVDCQAAADATNWTGLTEDIDTNTESSSGNPSAFAVGVWAYASAAPAAPRSVGLVMG